MASYSRFWPSGLPPRCPCDPSGGTGPHNGAQSGPGDQVAVGPMDQNVYTNSILTLPLPSQTNEKFCTLFQLGPNLLAWAYVPTAAERTGDFSQFQGTLVDPQSDLPYPGNIIPVSDIPGVFAWRIAPSGPGPTETCLPVPSFPPPFGALDYVTGSAPEQVAAGTGLLAFVYTLGDPLPAP